MRAVVQRVSRAAVTVGDRTVGEIGPGLLVLVAVATPDTSRDARIMADKLCGLRIFGDDSGRMNRSVVDVAGSILVVSQFTLLADARKGRRPSFAAAAPPEIAQPLIAEFSAMLAANGVTVAGGEFGAMMEVSLVNDGPVTLVLDVAEGKVR
jgi:D-tyrosyl-tRNA(Tyr) deacylase